MSRLFELAYYSFCLCLLANGQRLEETVDILKYSKCGTETEAACIKPLCKEGMYTFMSKLKNRNSYSACFSLCQQEIY